MADLDPVKAWNGLSKNGKIAVVAGVLAISIFIWYREKQKAAAASASAASASASDQTDSNANGDNSANSDEIDPSTGIPYSQESGYDTSVDPTSEYLSGYEDAMSAYGGDSGLGYSYGADTSGTDTSTGAGATTSTTPPTDITVNIPSNSPSSTTGGGAPSSPSATAAHGAPKPAKPALTAGAISTTNASGKPVAKAGYTLIGTGSGGYQYVPNSKAKKGYKIYPKISKTKPQANAIGLGNGLWEVPA